MAKPILLSSVDTETLPEEEWLRWREHGPDGSIKWTIGGSAVSIIMGVNPWTTLREFYDMKKGIIPAWKVNYNAQSKAIGHVEEAHILFNILKPQLEKDYPGHKIEIGQDKCMYQCGVRNPDGTLRYPYMVMNIDGYCRIDGKLFGVEVKTTNPQGVENINKWKSGIVPEYYDYQCRYYMRGFDLDGWIIVCRWDIRGKGEGFNYIFIERDKDIEDFMMEKCDNFISMLENDTPPSITDDDPTLALDYYNRLYAVTLDDKTEIDIPAQYAKEVSAYLEAEEKIKAYEKKIEQLRKYQDKQKVILMPFFKNVQKGRIDINANEAYFVNFTPTYKRKIVIDEAKLKADFPAEYAACLKSTVDIETLKKDHKKAFSECRIRELTGERRFSARKWVKNKK